MQYAHTIPNTVPIINNLIKELPNRLLTNEAEANIVTDKMTPGMAYPLIEKLVIIDKVLFPETRIP